MTETCKGCGAEMIWKTTIKGKAVPLDPPEKRYVEFATGLVEIRQTWQGHHVTCPKAKNFRTSRTS